MSGRVLKVGLLFLVAVSPSMAAAAPACIPPIEVSHAKVVQVEKNGAIALAGGRTVRLEGVLLPAGPADHGPQFIADQAIARLRDLTKGHWLALALESPKEDRYGRLRAQILLGKDDDDDTMWLQLEMLRRGLARVSLAPDRGECAEELYAAESRARREKTGIWSSPAYAVRNPSQTASEVGTFHIVAGVVRSVSSSGGRVFLDFGSDRGNGFAATISPEDLKRFREIGVDPFAYKNETVRVRGWIERIGRRPEIALATPRQVEIIAAPGGPAE